MSASSPRHRIPAAAALCAVAALCAACGGSGPSGAAADAKANVKLVDATPVAAGQLDRATWLVAKEPTNLDLSNADANDQSDLVMANVCERLNQLRPDMSVGPGLAAKYEWKTPTQLVFTLRDNATFHDGAPVTMDDVVWSMRRNATDGNAEADEFPNVASFAQTGPHELTFTMKQPDAVFVEALAGDAGLIQERKVVEAQGKAFGTPSSPDACSGPLQLKEWKPGTSIVLTRAEHYWDPARASKVEEVTFKWAADDAIVNSLVTGSAQGAYIDNIASASRLVKTPGITVSQGPDTRVWSYLVTGRGGLADPAVRKALSLAVDRDGVNRAAFAGLGQPWKEPVGSGAWGYEKAAFQSAYDQLAGSPAKPSDADIAEAKKLLGAGSHQPIVVASDGSSIRDTLANALVAAAQRIGLQASITQIPTVQYGDFYDNTDLRARADVYMDDYFVSKSDPVGFYKNGASSSKVQWVFKDPAYDQLVLDGRAALDDAARAKIAVQLARRWSDAKPWISAILSPSTVALSGKVTGVPASGAYRYYPWAADLGTKG
ncbi:peptide ABC transporter substrate-binding protein [Amycolatopsis sp. NBRC 101858]|uniref:ABC transporter substrate-binding protein n=1 Tax=Amycolatopsis sp. NBRC 101858 TaxID=3032200 RepID=UPI0024A51AEF|nr:ABC transporter substrate-binding protein [Amycolatopsis sp. NBRC 101858]GLY37023.1 peptide ABC transporter substrate-binding protein [Amycolatopsis sp. NBRC 101858]